MQTTNIAISKLVENKGQIEGLPKNPRIIKNERFTKLVKSIEDAPEMLDMRTLIVVEHGEKYVVICGNMRLRACQELGYKELPCYVLPADTPAEKLREYTIKDNVPFGETNFDDIANEWDMQELDDWGFELNDDWLHADEQGDEDATDDGFTDEEAENAPAKVQPGDVWLLGEHRLLCGDSTDKTCVERLMNGEKADICFTSPPYNAGNTPTEVHSQKDGKYLYVEDNKTQDEYCNFLTACTNNFLTACKYVFINIQMLSNNKIAFIEWLNAFKKKLADIIIWDKGASQPAMAKNVLNSEFEFVCVFSDKGKRNIGTRRFHGTLANIIHVSNKRQSEFADVHNATFPIEFANHFVKEFSTNSVLEPFGGTGTTLIACEQLKRKCFILELDPHYCDIIIARWEKLTGKTATKEA